MRDKYIIFCTITKMKFVFKSCQNATSKHPQAEPNPSAHVQGIREAAVGPAHCSEQYISL